MVGVRRTIAVLKEVFKRKMLDSDDARRVRVEAKILWLKLLSHSG
jgi:hypothetical protein